MSKDLKGRNIIITGCFGQIGSYLCKELINYDVNIFGIDYINNKEQIHKKFCYYKCDLTKEEEVNLVINKIYKKTNRVDCLIHLAGIDYKIESGIEKESFDFDSKTISPPTQVMKSVNANISMVYNIIYSLLSRFLNQKESRIILIGSVYGEYSPNPNLYKSSNAKYFYQKPIEYSLSKSTFPILTKYLCAHYSSKGLTVNNLEPHAIIKNPDEEFLKNFRQLSPIGRICTAEEIIDFIIYLISSKCTYLNGETIRIDGGWTSY